MSKLHSYQRESANQIFAAFKKHRRVLFTLPTGAGKTYVGAYVIRQYLSTRRRVLVLAHRREIVEQLVARLIADGIPENKISVIMSGDIRENAQALVHVASVDTLTRRAGFEKYGLIVIDEAHRSVAPKFLRITDRYKNAKILGLTATPCRLDHKPMGTAYDVLVVGAQHPELFDGGYLVKPRVFSKAEQIDLSSVPTTAGDFSAVPLFAAVNKRALRGDIVAHFKSIAGQRAALGFAVNREHASSLAKDFNDSGIPAEVVDAFTPKDEREAILGHRGRLARGKTRIVWTVDIASEGLDRPFIKCIVMARPTRSLVVYMQQCGRALRPFGKDAPIILDHAGNAMRFDLPQAPREWSLESAPKHGAQHGAMCKTCPACGESKPCGLRTCDCGHEFDIGSIPEHEEGQLQEMVAKDWVARVAARAKKLGLNAVWLRQLKRHVGAA